MSSIIEEKLRERAEAEKQAEQKQVESVVADADAAIAARQEEAPELRVPGPGEQPQVKVPTKRMVMKFRAYMKDFVTGSIQSEPSITDEMPVNVPDLPNDIGEAMVQGEMFKNFRNMGAVVQRVEKVTAFYPFDLFGKFEFEMGVVEAIQGVALAERH